MRVVWSRARARERGQSTVEFMLMVPVILSIFFFVIEMGLYFTAVHYTHYAAFVTARSLAANYGTSDYQSASKSKDDIAKLVLTGSVFERNYDVTETSNKSGIQIKLKHWKTNFPFLSVLIPNMPYATSVSLGKREADYEKVKSQICTDNDVSSLGKECN